MPCRTRRDYYGRAGHGNKIIKDVLGMVERYGLSENIDTSYARERAKWSVIGYSSDKEYSFEDILCWYNNLVKYDYHYIYQYARKLKMFSSKIEELGDNRFCYEVNCKLYSDLFHDGVPEIKKIMSSPGCIREMLEQPEYMIEGFIGYLENARLSEKELLSMWAFGIGVLDWRNDSEYSAIHALRKSIEICADANGISGLHDKMAFIGKAEIEICAESSYYIIPERWCDKEDADVGGITEPDMFIDEYLLAENETGQDTEQLIVALNAVRKDSDKYNAYLCEILEKEIFSEQHGWRNNRILEYIVSNLPNNLADIYIKRYFISGLNQEINRFYPYEYLGVLTQWKARQCGEEYCKESLNNLLDMQLQWMNSSGKIVIQECSDEVEDAADLQKVYSLLNMDGIISFEDIYVRMLLVFLLGDDSDAAETALRGLYHILLLNPECIGEVEKRWDYLHYRAKEWVLMIYELLAKVKALDKRQFENIVSAHVNDKDFNAALYARIMMQELCGKNLLQVAGKAQEYFSSVPEYGIKKLIKIKSDDPHLMGMRYVMKTINRLEECMVEECSDIERVVAEYMDKIEDCDNMLIKLGRHMQYHVALSRINIAFFRVLYKNWYQGRWNGLELSLSRVLLSASEPYILLQSPGRWPYCGGRIFKYNDDPKYFMDKSSDEKDSILKAVFYEGIQEDEVVLGGSLVEYTYEEIIGFMTTYIKFPGMEREYALNSAERNERLLFQQSDHFREDEHYNLILHNTGVQSFKGSNIMCIISKQALKQFGWRIVLNKSLEVLNSAGEKIGRFDYFYGSRAGMGNNIRCNQSFIQRWIIKKDAFGEIQKVFSIELDQAADIRVLNHNKAE